MRDLSSLPGSEPRPRSHGQWEAKRGSWTEKACVTRVQSSASPALCLHGPCIVRMHSLPYPVLKPQSQANFPGPRRPATADQFLLSHLPIYCSLIRESSVSLINSSPQRVSSLFCLRHPAPQLCGGVGGLGESSAVTLLRLLKSLNLCTSSSSSIIL